MDAHALIRKHYDANSRAYHMLVEHSEAVALKAVRLAQAMAATHPAIDHQFIRDAALLHDIGIRFTYAPRLGCRGDHPYCRHGVLGRELLEAEGLPRHALVAERHIGVGLSVDDIDLLGWTLPRRDMQPQSIEERIITYADCFFTKQPGRLREELSIEEARLGIARFGEERVRIFDAWNSEFEAGGAAG